MQTRKLALWVYSDPIRCDRQYGEQHGGGLAVYFKNSVRQKEIYTVGCAKMEAVSIRVSPCSSPAFMLEAVCRPICQAGLEPYMSSFPETVIDKSADIDDLVVIGDINVNLLRVNNASRAIDVICQSFDLHQLVDEPTRVTESYRHNHGPYN